MKIIFEYKNLKIQETPDYNLDPQYSFLHGDVYLEVKNWITLFSRAVRKQVNEMSVELGFKSYALYDLQNGRSGSKMVCKFVDAIIKEESWLR